MFYLEMGSSSDIVVPGEGMVMSRKSMVVQGVLLMRTSCNMAVQWRDGNVKECTVKGDLVMRNSCDEAVQGDLMVKNSCEMAVQGEGVVMSRAGRTRQCRGT